MLGGEYHLDCEEDGLRAANITIYDGRFDIRCGDDGMHADGSLVINSAKH